MCTKEEQDILQRDSNKSQKLLKKLMAGQYQFYTCNIMNPISCTSAEALLCLPALHLPRCCAEMRVSVFWCGNCLDPFIQIIKNCWQRLKVILSWELTPECSSGMWIARTAVNSISYRLYWATSPCCCTVSVVGIKREGKGWEVDSLYPLCKSSAAFLDLEQRW